MLEPSAVFAQTDRSEDADVPPALPPGERPFVGREAELAELRLGLDTVLRGAGRTFLISGEPGIGKTRLASELGREARARGFRVEWGRCWEAGGAPSYWPWLEVIRQLAAASDAPEKIDLGRRGLHLAQIVPELAHRLGVADIAPPVPTDPESARFLLFDAVAAFFREAASRGPLVVVVDDLHAADRASLLLFAFLARALADCGMLVIGTHRDHGFARDLKTAFLELGRHARRLSLRGLEVRDVSRLIEHESDFCPSDALLAKIHGVTDGNPFFVDEIVRLAASDGTFDASSQIPSLKIPDGIRDAIRRRLIPLSPASRSILELASVMGREFDCSILRRATQVEVVSLLELLEDPLRRGVVTEISGPPGRFQFRHALIREVLYDDLPPALRLSHHKRIGEAFEAHADVAPDRYLPELAHHFLAAAPCGESNRFVQYGVRAAQQSMDRMAFEEASRLYERTIEALVHLPPNERLRCELLLALGRTKEWVNDLTSSRATFEEAAAIARRLDATDLFVQAALGFGAVDSEKAAASRCHAAPELIREALERVPPDDSLSRARLLGRLSLHLMSTGSGEDAIRLTETAVLLARSSGDLETLGHALIARQVVLFGPDWLDERATIAEELAVIARHTNQRQFAMRALAIKIAILFEIGDISGTGAALDAHQRLADESSDPFERWANLVWRATRALFVGRLAECEALSHRAFELVQTVPGPHASELYGPSIFAAQTMLVDDIRSRNDPDPEIALHYASLFPEVSTWRVAVLGGYIRRRRVDEIRRELAPLAAKRFRDIERNGTWLSTMSYLSEAVALVGDRDQASMLYEEMLPYAQRNVTISGAGCRGSVAHYLALLAATLGNFDDAIRHFEEAIGKNREMGARPHVALASYDYAAFLAECDPSEGKARAQELLAEAHAIASELSMGAVIDRCRDLAQRLDGSSGDPSPAARSISLQRTGSFWALSFGDQRVHLKDSKGLIYIAELLRQPLREIHALDLIAVAAGTRGDDRASSTERREPDGRQAGVVSSEVTDAKARRAYRRRIDDLRNDLAEAESRGDPERVLTLREELDALRRELARSIGLGGRARHASDAERARVSVTRAIRLALARIADEAPGLGAELARDIRTGTFCVYERRALPA